MLNPTRCPPSPAMYAVNKMCLWNTKPTVATTFEKDNFRIKVIDLCVHLKDTISMHAEYEESKIKLTTDEEIDRTKTICPQS